jgi:hypothetical protein
MPDRTGADDLVPEVGAVGAIRFLATDHACVILGGDLDTAELIILLSQAGMVLGALLGLQQYF